MIPLLVLARTLHVGSALLIVGLLYFQVAILGGWKGDPAQDVRCCLGRWMIGTLAVHIFSGALWFWIAAAGMNDCSLIEAWNGNLLPTILEQTQFGRLWILRAALALALGFSLFLTRENKRGGVALGLAVLLLASLAWAGHAASGINYRTLHLGFDIAHLTVAAVWPVGLVPLALFLHISSRTNEPAFLSVLHRFSRASLVCVILISLTGLANALFLIPSFAALFTSTYGQLLVGKVLLFFIMALIGAANRLFFLPNLASDSSAGTRLRRAVLVENALGLIILVIVGTMGATSPAQ